MLVVLHVLSREPCHQGLAWSKLGPSDLGPRFNLFQPFLNFVYILYIARSRVHAVELLNFLEEIIWDLSSGLVIGLAYHFMHSS